MDLLNERAYAFRYLETVVRSDTEHFFHQPLSLAMVDTVDDLIREQAVWLETSVEKRHRVADKLFSREG